MGTGIGLTFWFRSSIVFIEIGRTGYTYVFLGFGMLLTTCALQVFWSVSAHETTHDNIGRMTMALCTLTIQENHGYLFLAPIAGWLYQHAHSSSVQREIAQPVFGNDWIVVLVKLWKVDHGSLRNSFRGKIVERVEVDILSPIFSFGWFL